MLSVLIIDDNPRKVEKIITVISEFTEIPSANIRVASSQVEGKSLLRKKQFDLVVLDIQLPTRTGEVPLANGGVNVLQEIHARTLYKRPMCIVGLTAYPELLTSATGAFAETMWSIVLYDDTSLEWADRLSHKIRYLLELKSHRVPGSKYKNDLGVITALNTPEFEAVLRLTTWKRSVNGSDSTIYMEGAFSEGTKQLSVVAACAPEMGTPAAAVLATKMIIRFAPQHLVLVGITAGIADRTNIGDFLVADPCWDWGGGKYKIAEGRTVFEPDPSPCRLSPHVKAMFQDVQLDNLLLNEVRSGWNGQKPQATPRLHIGPCASGASVIADQGKVAMIKQGNRKLVGIDMESYGVMHAAFHAATPSPYAFSLKVVSDYADEAKNDQFQEYAAYASATLLHRIALKYF
jgi:nucleoside phosphorylase/CheY-like chemotaxis protein